MTHLQLIDGEWREVSDEQRHLEFMAEAHANGWDPCPDCYSARIDGVCNPCRNQGILNADPTWSAWSDALARLDHGMWDLNDSRPYTFNDRKADEVLLESLERKMAQGEYRATLEPDGCRHCGVPSRDHGQRFGGGHFGDNPRTYVAPTDAQRKARMVARRNTRLGLLPWAALSLGGAA